MALDGLQPIIFNSHRLICRQCIDLGFVIVEWTDLHSTDVGHTALGHLPVIDLTFQDLTKIIMGTSAILTSCLQCILGKSGSFDLSSKIDMGNPIR